MLYLGARLLKPLEMLDVEGIAAESLLVRMRVSEPLCCCCRCYSRLAECRHAMSFQWAFHSLLQDLLGTMSL